MKSGQSNTALQRFFTGVTEYVFQTQLGVVDPPLIDYVSDMLLRFVRVDTIFRVRDVTGRPMTQVVDMLIEAEARVGAARRDVHRHIGDFTLFWAGLFPEALRKLRSPSCKDHFVDYCHQGKRAYLIASTIETDDDVDISNDVLERLSHCFEMCAYGLREVRREWERSDDDDLPKPLLLN